MMNSADEDRGSGRRAGKSPTAFRTISEVSDELNVPAHVLRFWETKFGQVRPMKRGGGRRYYRPEDIDLLRRIRSLLYDEGYTIKGVQKLLREGGVRPAAARVGTEPTAASEPTAEPPSKPVAESASKPSTSAPAPVPFQPKLAGLDVPLRRALDPSQRRDLGEVLGELKALRALLSASGL